MDSIQTLYSVTQSWFGFLTHTVVSSEYGAVSKGYLLLSFINSSISLVQWPRSLSDNKTMTIIITVVDMANLKFLLGPINQKGGFNHEHMYDFHDLEDVLCKPKLSYTSTWKLNYLIICLQTLMWPMGYHVPFGKCISPLIRRKPYRSIRPNFIHWKCEKRGQPVTLIVSYNLYNSPDTWVATKYWYNFTCKCFASLHSFRCFLCQCRVLARYHFARCKLHVCPFALQFLSVWHIYKCTCIINM